MKNWRPAELQFTANGAEYARLWQVNLLLTLLTLGLYRPFAKVRKLQYLYAHTWFDGHSLAFHGNPWRMLGGYLVMLTLFTLYSASTYAKPMVYLAAAVLLALLWPALWRSGLRYRLGHTSWRGLRFGFTGSVAGAYRAMLPWVLPPVLYGVSVVHFAPNTLLGELPKLPTWVWVLNAVVAFGSIPLGLAWVKRYQNNGYRFAGQAAKLEMKDASFFRLGTQVFFLSILALLMALAVIAVVKLVSGAWLSDLEQRFLFFVLWWVAIYLVVLVGGAAQFAAGTQNIVWNATHSEDVRFRSFLDAPGYAALQLKNWSLVALTLGLYRPFALISAQRMRLEAIRIELADEPAQWTRTPGMGRTGTQGEMSGDFFGLDLGW